MNIAEAASIGIKNSLITCAIKGEFIKTHRYARGIGKTTSLIQFAKEYGFCLIVNDATIANGFKREYNYNNIFGKSQIRGMKLGRCVVDEGVNIVEINSENATIVTGFILVE